MNSTTSEGRSKRPVNRRGLAAIGVLLACIAVVIAIALIVHHHEVVKERRTACEFQMAYQGYSVADAVRICANK